MSDYYISQIRPDDKPANQQLDLLLSSEGIRRDANLDYTCGMFDEEMNLVAAGSCFGNTLRCLACSRCHQGEGLMNQIMTHLMEIQVSRGNTHLFLYTKCSSAGSLQTWVFMRLPGQTDRLFLWKTEKTDSPLIYIGSPVNQVNQEGHPLRKGALPL